MNLLPAIESLRQKRPVFHSEADFQFALAWEIKRLYDEAEIRLEVPSNTSIKGRVDIVVRHEGAVFPIELKYLKKMQSFLVNDERFNLVDGVHDMDMHDCIKDIARLETFQAEMEGFSAGYALWLTNDPAYWDSEYDAAYYCEFHAPHTSLKTGTMSFKPGSKMSSHPQYGCPITLKGSYTVFWNDYYDHGVKNGLFRYALIDVSGKGPSVIQETADLSMSAYCKWDTSNRG